ncbi:anti-phage deoxyguanosine triphosphatase [Pseudomonas syringae]|uniref:anti-phage deoxyguanosine triphosphatase n=1 Tax=Pseudomonas syringae TaxID=317 RepID=UPI0004124E79|nr:anti-phage deoxyguanosine triphosphatase [Pseudomonas syringae]
MWEERFFEAENSSFKRDEYARDRARIIHSAFFRRLQGKTQVLGLGESDFYRTRLTHSLEVAQIGGGIAEFLKTKYHQDESVLNIIPDQNLIESLGLAHDIGHPPFGHGGEVALNYAMRDDSGFEGNAQTLRICTLLGECSDANGLNLTRRVLLGLIKYPSYYSSVVNLDAYKGANGLNLDNFKPPKCIFDSDKTSAEWVLKPFTQDRDKFMEFADKGKTKHRKSRYKSFDCSIMELADDIAYGVHDLEDAVALSLVTESQWRSDVVSKLTDCLKSYPLSKDIRAYTAQLFSGGNKTRKIAISKLVGYFIKNVQVSKVHDFSHDLLAYQASFPSDVREELDVFQEFVRENVIKTPEVQTLEYKGQQMIVKLFESISANPSRLLPKKYYVRWLEEKSKNRVVCDYLAGTTDDYATRLYHKIFTPSSGSIFDKL